MELLSRLLATRVADPLAPNRAQLLEGQKYPYSNTHRAIEKSFLAEFWNLISAYNTQHKNAIKDAHPFTCSLNADLSTSPHYQSTIHFFTVALISLTTLLSATAAPVANADGASVLLVKKNIAESGTSPEPIVAMLLAGSGVPNGKGAGDWWSGFD
ncbi:hypothetical protein EXIGLDRAFT_776134 [Exidia glandulosa HHB12029]|uniref:Uncharacterized protein n=1 Tax=Exidia glandulosa HHB12029 TaxID=1314781 RepID=A0A165DL85_EXIGL|nr:hypothetical protein EXIGLDRAFT_776134 [Exidia glandulosa HHB12029]